MRAYCDCCGQDHKKSKLDGKLKPACNCNNLRVCYNCKCCELHCTCEEFGANKILSYRIIKQGI